MKKFLLLFLLSSIFSITLSAQEATVDGIFYDLNSYSNTAAVISTGNPDFYKGEVVIPEGFSYEGTPYKVTSIEEMAFYGNTNLTGIVVPPTVEFIGDMAFADCPNLKDVTIYSDGFVADFAFENSPVENLYINSQYIGMGPFPYLKNLTLGNSVEQIGMNAFTGCQLLESLDIPDSVKRISSHGFFGCSSLKTVKIGNSLTVIPDFCFSGCTSLKSIEIGKAVNTIMGDAFNGCEALEKVIISDLEAWCKINFGENNNYNILSSNPLIYAHHLYLNDEEITDLKIPSTIETINNKAFISCSGLNSVEFPTSVSKIGSSAFRDCSELSSVSLPGSLTSLGSACFMDCVSLKNIEFPESLTEIESSTFRNTGLETICFPENITTIKQNAFSQCGNLQEIDLGQGVTTIEQEAFYETGVESLIIPSSVIRIESRAFAQCPKFNNLIFNAENIKLDFSVFEESPIVNIEINSVYVPYPLGRFDELENVKIGDSTKEIESGVFAECPKLKNVIIGKSVEMIGEYAFNRSPIENLTLNYPSIKKNFRNFESLRSLTLGAPVSTIEAAAFEGCSNLTALNFDAENCNVCGNEFSPAFPSSVSEVSLGNEVTSIPAYFLKENERITTLEFPASLSVIGNGAFEDCTNLKALDFPVSLTAIGERAFRSCSNLEEISFNSTEQLVLGDNSFEECLSLKQIYGNAHIPPVSESFNVFSDETYSGANLVVDAQDLADYRKTTPWSRFFRGELTGIETIDDSETATELNSIFDVYDINGMQVLKSATREELNKLGSGLYVINGKKVWIP